MDSENITQAELERLQTEQTYQADMLSALNDALAAQQMELLGLREHVRLLEGRLRELLQAAPGQGEGADGSVEPPPPHY